MKIWRLRDRCPQWLISAGAYLAVGMLFFGLFLAAQATLNGFLSADDPYYHAQHSALMWQTGDFTLVGPWIEPHFLTYAPADPYWLAHVLQAVFIGSFGVVAGTKIFTAFCAALLCTIFYYLVRSYGAPAPLVWTFLLVISSSEFTLRLLLPRPFIISITVLLLLYHLAVRRRYYALGFTFALYALLYHFAIAGFAVLAAVSIAQWWRTQTGDVRLWLAAGSGYVLGVILHPQTLNYLYVIYVTFFKLPRYYFSGQSFAYANEMSIPTLAEFFTANSMVMLCLMAAYALYIVVSRERRTAGVAITALAISVCGWSVIALLAHRAVEYWAPFAWLFIAQTVAAARTSGHLEQLRSFMAARLHGWLLAAITIGSSLMLFVAQASIVTHTIVANRVRHSPVSDYAAAAAWLKANVPDQSTIFYPEWSMFPLMFYTSPNYRYVAGWYGFFLYEYNPALYYAWQNISYYGYYGPCVHPCFDFAPRTRVRSVPLAITRLFGSRTVVMPNHPESALYRALAASPQVRLTYTNEALVIFTFK